MVYSEEEAPHIGPGWTIRVVPRRNQTTFSSDKYFYSPEGRKFRSMAEVRRYLKDQNKDENKNDNGNDDQEQMKNDVKPAASKEVKFGAVGYKFKKHFEGYGWFVGEVVKIRPGAAFGRDRRVRYSDGDAEDLSLEELRALPPVGGLKKAKKNEKKTTTTPAHVFAKPASYRRDVDVEPVEAQESTTLTLPSKQARNEIVRDPKPDSRRQSASKIPSKTGDIKPAAESLVGKEGKVSKSCVSSTLPTVPSITTIESNKPTPLVPSRSKIVKESSEAKTPALLQIPSKRKYDAAKKSPIECQINASIETLPSKLDLPCMQGAKKRKTEPTKSELPTKEPCSKFTTDSKLDPNKSVLSKLSLERKHDPAKKYPAENKPDSQNIKSEEMGERNVSRTDDDDVPLPLRKSRRDAKPTRKLEEYYIHQIATSTERKRASKKQETPPEAKKSKLLSSTLDVPIDKAAESTLQTNPENEIHDNGEPDDDDERGWYVKVATYLSVDTQRAKRDRLTAPRVSTKGVATKRNSFNEASNDVASSCSTISCSSDIEGMRSSPHRSSARSAGMKQPPEAVLVSKSPEAAAAAPTMFRFLSDFKPGTRFGKKVYHKDDRKRIVREVIFERSSGWVEVNVGGHLENMRSGQLIVVPSDRFAEGDRVPENYDVTAPEADQVETATETAVYLDKKMPAKRPSLEGSLPSMKKSSTPIKRTQTITTIDSLFYWKCEQCEVMNKFSENVCLSCDSERTPTSKKSPLLEVAERAVDGASSVEDAMSKVPTADQQSIPEMIVSVLMDPRLREFCVEPSSDFETYFYWNCKECTMQNSYKKLKCLACLRDKDQDVETSTLLRIAEGVALQSKTTEEAFSLVPEHERRSIPQSVMESLVTCVATVSDGKRGDRRCRRAKISGYDYCTAHCDPLLLTAQTQQPKEASRTESTSPRPVRGIAAIIANMSTFLKTKYSANIDERAAECIANIEDSVLLDESKPFPLGLKVRKFFTGYGFHDGQIIRVCRKFVVLQEGSATVRRPVLVYRVVYNDGDREDLIRSEISSLCQVYNRNVSPEAPANVQIPPGTMFQMTSGSTLKVLQHTTPPDISDPDEGGTVIVSFDNSPKHMELDLLKLQMSVLRRVENPGRSGHPNEDASQTVPVNEHAFSERSVAVVEWPGINHCDNSKFTDDDHQLICRGLKLRRTSNPHQEYHKSEFSKASNVDDPRDARPGCRNRGMWDPSNGFPFLSWDPYLTVTCEICNVDKDDHQVVICDHCHSGYHTYCVRPVMVVVPNDEWLCSKCTNGQPNAISFEEYAANVTIPDVEEFMSLDVLSPEKVASVYSSFRYQKNDWRIPVPLMSKQEYEKSLISFVAAMKYCGMSSYSEELLYPADKGTSKEMNDNTLDVDFMQPVSKRNMEIFRAFKNNLKMGAFPPVQVVHDEHFGFSVEAMVAIQRHTLIAEYVGEIVTMEQSDDIRSDSLMVLLQTGKRDTSLIIDPSRAGNIARFLSGINNRSLVSRRKANVRTLRFSIDGHVRVALFTSRRIEPGEKLQYDYNAGVKGKSLEELAESGFYDTSNFF